MKKYGRITPKTDTHLQTMTKTSAKFQKNWLKTVRGVASTSYPSHCVYGRTEGQTHFNSPIRLTSEDNKNCQVTILRNAQVQINMILEHAELKLDSSLFKALFDRFLKIQLHFILFYLNEMPSHNFRENKEIKKQKTTTKKKKKKKKHVKISRKCNNNEEQPS